MDNRDKYINGLLIEREETVKNLRSELAAAQAALAKMTAERDDLEDTLHEAQELEAVLMQERNAAQARAERLAEALRPFAEYADTQSNLYPDDTTIAYNARADARITIGQCRAARAVLSRVRLDAEGGDVADPIAGLDPVEQQIQEKGD